MKSIEKERLGGTKKEEGKEKKRKRQWIFAKTILIYISFPGGATSCRAEKLEICRQLSLGCYAPEHPQLILTDRNTLYFCRHLHKEEDF